jgi:hypothetical protein
MNSDVKYQSMDDQDIHFYLPKAKLIQYNDLKKYKTIEKLLPKHKSYFILLYPVQSEMSGHWVCMTRYDKTIEYFDSYGLKPDIPFSWDTSNFRENEIYLSKLLNKTRLPIVYNTIDFQSKKDLMMATCGAYAVFRVLTLLEFNANLQQNNLMLKTLKETTDEPYDDIVVNFINKR